VAICVIETDTIYTH